MSYNTPDIELDFIDWLSTDAETQKSSDKVEEILSLLESIREFLSLLKSPKNIDEFIAFQNCINDEISFLFSSELDWETDDFKAAFSHSNKEHYKWDKNADNLSELLIKKHSIYNIFIYEALKQNMLNKVFSSDDKKTLMAISDSWIMHYFNRLFIDFKKSLEESIHENYQNWTLKKPQFGFLINGKIKSYRDALSLDSVRFDFFDKIPDWSIKTYFQWLKQLLESGNINYQDWTDLERNALDTWIHTDSSLCIVAPIESYELEGVLIDPEVAIFMSIPDSTNASTWSDLSKRTFWKTFWIESVNPFKTQQVISWWDSAINWCLGKNFPNDPNLRNEYWTLNFSVHSKLWAKSLEKLKPEYDLFWLTDIDIDSYTKMDIEHVDFHEYGHNLYDGFSWNSSLEEAKADLFSTLHIYDNFQKQEFTDKEVKEHLDYICTGIVSRVKHIKKDGRIKYVISEKISLRLLLENDLIYLNDNGEIEYNISIDSFWNYLSQMKDVLFMIWDIYGSNDWPEKEQQFLDKLYLDIDPVMESMHDKLMANQE